MGLGTIYAQKKTHAGGGGVWGLAPDMGRKQVLLINCHVSMAVLCGRFDVPAGACHCLAPGSDQGAEYQQDSDAYERHGEAVVSFCYHRTSVILIINPIKANA